MKNTLLRMLYHLLRFTRPRTRQGSELRTVLILQYQMPLGCCVHGTPIFAAIKAARPDVTVIVATRGLGYEVLQHDPHIDYLIETEDPMAPVQRRGAVVRKLRKELRRLKLKPDLILQDASNRRGLFALIALCLRLAPTAGFANAAPLYDTPLEYDPSLSLIDNNLRLAELAGASRQHIEPAVHFTAAELTTARALLSEAPQGLRPIAAFVVRGSGGQRTGWHHDRFAAVVRHVESRGHRAVFLGTAADVATIEGIRALAASGGVSLAGRTSVPELAAALCLCDLLVTLDTGTMHVGRAAGLPMVVLGPSWQRPLEWLPLGKPNVRILRGADRDSVPPDYRLDEISVEEVIAAIEGLQRSFPSVRDEQERRVERLLSGTRP